MRIGGEMGNAVVTVALALAVSSVGGNACAMNGPVPERAHCTVAGSELLPAESGGAAELCEVIGRTLAAGAGESASVEVRVLSPQVLAATATLADGTTLPEVRAARADRPLGRRSFQLLANALAEQLAGDRD